MHKEEMQAERQLDIPKWIDELGSEVGRTQEFVSDLVKRLAPILSDEPTSSDPQLTKAMPTSLTPVSEILRSIHVTACQTNDTLRAVMGQLEI